MHFIATLSDRQQSLQMTEIFSLSTTTKYSNNCGGAHGHSSSGEQRAENKERSNDGGCSAALEILLSLLNSLETRVVFSKVSSNDGGGAHGRSSSGDSPHLKLHVSVSIGRMVVKGAIAAIEGVDED